jgi:hypothetical protein
MHRIWAAAGGASPDVVAIVKRCAGRAGQCEEMSKALKQLMKPSAEMTV